MPKVLVIRTLIIQSDQTDRKLRPVLHQIPQADKRDHVFIRFACTFFIFITQPAFTCSKSGLKIKTSEASFWCLYC